MNDPVAFVAGFETGRRWPGYGGCDWRRRGCGYCRRRCVQAMGRNPDAAPLIQTNMILGMAFAEAVAIYALAVALIILFAS